MTEKKTPPMFSLTPEPPAHLSEMDRILDSIDKLHPDAVLAVVVVVLPTDTGIRTQIASTGSGVLNQSAVMSFAADVASSTAQKVGVLLGRPVEADGQEEALAANFVPESMKKATN